VTDIQKKLPVKQNWNEHVKMNRAKGTIYYDGIHQRKDGRRFPVEVNGSFVTLEHKEYVIAVVRDISERQHTEELKRKQVTLRESERMFRQSLENIDLISFSIDFNMHINFVNDTFIKLTGWEKKNIMAKNWLKLFVSPSQRKNAEHTFKEMLEGEISKGQKPSSFNKRTQIEILTRSGKKRKINWNLALMLDDEGNHIGLTGVGEDVTQKELEEKALRVSEERYRDLIENSKDIICTHDVYT